MGMVVVVESGSIGKDSTACEYGHQTPGLLSGGQNPEDSFAAGDGDALTLQLRDGIGHARCRWLVGEVQ